MIKLIYTFLILVSATTFSSVKLDISLNRIEYQAFTDYLKGSTSIERIDKKDDTLVSAKVTNEKNQKYFYLMMAFKVNAPFAVTKSELTNFGRFIEIKSFVKKADFDREKGTFYIDSGIWGYYFRADVIITEDLEDRSRWTVVGGSYDGLTGIMRFWKKSEKETYVLVEAYSAKEKYIVPDWVMERGSEIVLKFGANYLRESVEKKYKN